MTLQACLPSKRMCSVYDSIAVVVVCAEAIQNVVALSLDLLPQLGESDQLILVGHSAEDGMPEKLAQLADLDSRVVPIITTRQDTGGGFNVGLREVVACYVMFLDGSTCLAPGGMSRLRSAIHHSKSSSSFVGIQDPSAALSVVKGQLNLASLHHEVTLGAFLFKRSVLAEKPFAEGTTPFHGLPMMARVVAEQGCQVIPGDFYVLSERAANSHNISSVEEFMEKVDRVFDDLPEHLQHLRRDFAFDSIQRSIQCAVMNGLGVLARNLYFEVLKSSPARALRIPMLMSLLKSMI